MIWSLPVFVISLKGSTEFISLIYWDRLTSTSKGHEVYYGNSYSSCWKRSLGCLHHQSVKDKPATLREKIYLETQFSQEIACLFTPNHIQTIWDLLHPYAQDGAGFIMEIHLDIGNDGLTKEFILDMTAKIRAMGLTAKIKPDAYAAFSYANRHTK